MALLTLLWQCACGVNVQAMGYGWDALAQNAVCPQCTAREPEMLRRLLRNERPLHRVPGPLAAGPGGSGLTRGASVAEKGVEADSQPRGSDVCPEHGTHRVGDCDTDT